MKNSVFPIRIKSVNVCGNLKSEFPIKILNYHDSIYVSRHNGNKMYPAGFFVFSYVGNLHILHIQKYVVSL